MKNYAVIENGIVTNIAVADDNWQPGGMTVVLAGDGCVIGSSYADGVFTLPEEPAPPPLTLEEAKAQQLLVIDAEFNQRANALLSPYPQAERETWGVQGEEALAWEADNSTLTPFLDGIAAARDVDPAAMRQSTAAQVHAFEAASQVLVGTRQKLRDQLSAATTPEAVQAVVWPETSA